MNNKISIILLCILLIIPSFNCQANEAKINNAAYILNTQTGEKIELDIIESSLTTNSNSRSSNSPEIITQTIEILFPDTGIQPRGSITKDEGDVSGSYSATLTISYSRYYESTSGDTRYLLNSLNGKWEQQDQQVSISDKTVYYGCNGFKPNVSNQAGNLTVSGMSFSKNTGFTKYISDAYAGNICGATMVATLKRAGSSHTWEFVLQNTIVDNDYIWPFESGSRK